MISSLHAAGRSLQIRCLIPKDRLAKDDLRTTKVAGRWFRRRPLRTKPRHFCRNRPEIAVIFYRGWLTQLWS